MNKLNLKKIKIIHGLPPKATKDDRVALDTEIFQMDKKRMHRPHGVFASLACSMDGKTAYIIQDVKQISDFMALLDDAVHIWHNSKFDIGQLRRFITYPDRTKLWDSMLIEQEMFSGWYDDFSQKALARRWLDLYMDKEVRDLFATASEMTPEMVQYAAGDVISLYQIYKAQKAYIDEKDINIWKKVDRGALYAVLDMDGMCIDQNAWTKIAKEQRKIADTLQAKYPEINLNSPKHQVLPYLQSLDKKYKKLTGTGEKILEKIKDECPFATDVLDFRKAAKAASTYGEKFLESIEANGRMYSDFKINGAATGRLSSSKPNLENIPKDKKYRGSFVAAPGNIFVDADWSAQEPRITAYLSQDEKLIDIFLQKKDPYIAVAKIVFGKDITKKDPYRNERMKPTVLGACYGLTEYGMEVEYGIPKEEGIELLDRFFDYFTGVRDWIKEQQNGREYVETIMGRKYWLNPYQDGSMRNAINSPVQGSAGDALKIASYQIVKQFNLRFDRILQYVAIVNEVHDEILTECEEDMKDDVVEIMHDTMIEVAEEMHPGIPADVEIGWGHTWAEAHK